jgi:hypothetical protein
MALPEIPNEDIGFAQAELTRLDNYEKIYKKTHPFPIRKTLSFIQVLGIEAFVAGLSSIGALVLAAIRTGTIFLQAEKTLLVTFGTTGILLQVLPLVSMIAALFAVEGYLFAQGLKKGRSKTAKHAVWGMIFAMGISIVAGVASSSGLIQNFTGIAKTILDVALAVMTGIGATVLAYYGGENLGTIFVRWDHMQSESDEQYNANVLTWNTKMQTEYRSRGRSAIFGLEKYSSKPPKEDTNEVVDPGVIDKVKNWLASNGLTAFDVGGDKSVYSITPADIAKALKIRKASSVRTVLSRLRKESAPEQVVVPPVVDIVAELEEVPAPVPEAEYIPLDQT